MTAANFDPSLAHAFLTPRRTIGQGKDWADDDDFDYAELEAQVGGQSVDTRKEESTEPQPAPPRQPQSVWTQRKAEMEARQARLAEGLASFYTSIILILPSSPSIARMRLSQLQYPLSLFIYLFFENVLSSTSFFLAVKAVWPLSPLCHVFRRQLLTLFSSPSWRCVDSDWPRWPALKNIYRF